MDHSLDNAIWCERVVSFRKGKSIAGKNRRETQERGNRDLEQKYRGGSQKCSAAPVNLSPGIRAFSFVPGAGSYPTIDLHGARARYEYLWSLFVCAWKIIKNMGLGSRLWEKVEWREWEREKRQRGGRETSMVLKFKGRDRIRGYFYSVVWSKKKKKKKFIEMELAFTSPPFFFCKK